MTVVRRPVVMLALVSSLSGDPQGGPGSGPSMPGDWAASASPGPWVSSPPSRPGSSTLGRGPQCRQDAQRRGQMDPRVRRASGVILPGLSPVRDGFPVRFRCRSGSPGAAMTDSRKISFTKATTFPILSGSAPAVAGCTGSAGLSSRRLSVEGFGLQWRHLVCLLAGWALVPGAGSLAAVSVSAAVVSLPHISQFIVQDSSLALWSLSSLTS